MALKTPKIAGLLLSPQVNSFAQFRLGYFSYPPISQFKPTLIMKIKVLHPSKRLGYIEKALAKSNVRIETLIILKATHDAPSVFFYVAASQHLSFNKALFAYTYSMVMLMGQPSGWLVSFSTSSLNPVSVTAPIEIETSRGDSLEKLKEIVVMMTIPTQTQFKFLFLCVKRSDITAKPCRIEATAPNEHSARMMLVRDFILLFAGRLPVQPMRWN
ncbi:host cell division inhibitor Icd-like protein [Xenorhabdus bovienii]|uniref:Putative bacteriophage protein (Modular protein) n=1 Tax=Xenorhabdus bovienii str. feltiae Moldova TaxID=1398200 RepID=A0A077NTM9_XENBV|nr:host cell division inhibitor Icd-like protein [Xenorhabdus bovienii]MCG3461331.1 host cell division inhibitor Icd-like protein [Xenorhabdus bovienii]CDH00936.1 Putative bacteriophage protein (modular protein) [Xenorhabdus bovienii str. feltiae Moldova]